MILLSDTDIDGRVSFRPTVLIIPMAVSLLTQLITLIDWFILTLSLLSFV